MFVLGFWREKKKAWKRGGHGRAWASGTTLSHSISTALLGKMFPVVLIPFASLCLLHSSAAKTKAMLDWSLVLLSRQEEDRRFSPEQAELSPIKTGRYPLVLGGACMAGCIMSPDPAGNRNKSPQLFPGRRMRPVMLTHHHSFQSSLSTPCLHLLWVCSG